MRSATPEGILGVGGNLSPGMLLSAYAQGVFPWFSENEPVTWWSPDPRFVVPLCEVHVSRRTLRLVRSRRFRVTLDTDFAGVIRGCAATPRPGQHGTWITDEMIGAYANLHELGFAHSCEVWTGDDLVGGLYGVSLGRMFFGESMFSRAANASKVGFVCFAASLRVAGYRIIDSQVHTEHVESLGGRNIPRDEFLSIIASETRRSPVPWTTGEIDPSVVEAAVADELAQD